MYHAIFVSFALALAGCATLPPPPGQESERIFVQETAKSYQDAYRIIAKQMRACQRVIGVFGNGYDIQADLDSASKTGVVELYPIGLNGAQKPEDYMFSKTIFITSTPSGSSIKTTGTTSKYVYKTHITISNWLNGVDSCSP